jgi:hypothetical protein
MHLAIDNVHGYIYTADFRWPAYQVFKIRVSDWTIVANVTASATYNENYALTVAVNPQTQQVFVTADWNYQGANNTLVEFGPATLEHTATVAVPAANSLSEAGLSQGGKIGVGIGVAVFGLLIIAVVVVLVVLRKPSASASDEGEKPHNPATSA